LPGSIRGQRPAAVLFRRFLRLPREAMSSKPSVLIVSRSLPFHRAGGMEFVAWDLARALAGAAAEVTVLTTRIPARPARFEEEGVVVHALKEADPGRYSGEWWRRSSEWFRSRDGKVDAVLSVSAGAYGLLPDRSRQPDTRFVMQAHGTSMGEIRSKLNTLSLSRWLGSGRNVAWLRRDLRAYPRFDRVVAVGPTVAAQLRAPPLSRVLPSERVLVIENGIDTERFRPDPSAGSEVRASLGWSADDLVVATVCRLHAQKGVAEALRGFAEFDRRRRQDAPRARWLVVGDGAARASIEAEASRLLPSDGYRIVGQVERNEIPAFLNAADVFLFTTRHLEGLPLNVLEAAATGLALVLSRTLQDGVDLPGSTRFVDPSIADEIANALDQVLSIELACPEARTPALPDRYTLKRSAARYAEVLFGEPEP
jgi:glycosyltransferase involved in cell wall biosynthesis